MSLAVSMDRANAAPSPDPAVYEQLQQFHGHACAGSIFGARLGLAAKQALKDAGGTGKFTARYYDLSCPVDGIQMTTGSTYGNRKLTVQDQDEHRLVLTASGNKRQVEARLTKKAEELGKKSLDLNRKASALLFSSLERLQLEKEIEEIYTWLKTAPDDEVVVVTALKSPKGKPAGDVADNKSGEGHLPSDLVVAHHLDQIGGKQVAAPPVDKGAGEAYFIARNR